MSGFEAGIHSTLWLLAFLAGVASVLVPTAVFVFAVYVLWSGPLARAGWRIRAWRVVRRVRARQQR